MVGSLNIEEENINICKRGILLIIISSACFALMALIVKFIQHTSLMEIIFFRCMPSIIILPILLKKKNISFYYNNKPLLLLRFVFGFFAMLIYFYTIRVMSLTDAITIRQLSPFFIIIISSIFLKEKVFFYQITIFLLALLGTILIIKPGLRLEVLPTIIAVIGSVSNAGTNVTLRGLHLTDHPLVIVTFFTFSSCLTSLIVMLWQGNFYFPDPVNLLLLILLGLISLLAQITLTKAYQFAPANILALYLYSQIIFATMFDFFFFKKILDLFSVLGLSFVIISGYLNYRLRVTDQKT